MDKNLYLLAELDNDTQIKIREFETIITENGLGGKQTKDIPYHITLCAFPVEEEKYLEELLEKTNRKEITITFSGLGLFGSTILFLNPAMNRELIELYLSLNEKSRNKNEDLAAHVTLLMDEPENIMMILPKLTEKIQEFSGKIKYISLYEFFPKRFIKRIELSV